MEQERAQLERNEPRLALMAEEEGRTLRQLVFPTNMNLRPMGITLPAITGSWELKASFIQILPKYHGMTGEDPQRHIQDFEMVCQT